MKHYLVDKSSNIESTGWENGVMEIKFRSGDVYRYHGVPEGKHLELMQAPSKGTFLHKEVKGKYPHVKVNPKKK